MHQVGVPRRPTQRHHHRPDDRRHEPGTRSERPRKATAVASDPERPVIACGHDIDVDPACTKSLDGVRDEAAREVALEGRIRRREDDYLHETISQARSFHRWRRS